jgi:hypothetical protein
MGDETTSQGRRPSSAQQKTTITSAGLHRKTVYFSDAEWVAIRRAAFEQDCAYTDVVREAVRHVLTVEGEALVEEPRKAAAVRAKRSKATKGRG